MVAVARYDIVVEAVESNERLRTEDELERNCDEPEL